MSETVHVKVVKGSVGAVFLTDSFKKGEVFETTRENALKFDPSFIQILEDLPPVEEVAPQPPESPETAEPNVEESINDAENPSVAITEVGEVEESAPKKKRRKAKTDA